MVDGVGCDVVVLLLGYPSSPIEKKENPSYYEADNSLKGMGPSDYVVIFCSLE